MSQGAGGRAVTTVAHAVDAVIESALAEPPSRVGVLGFAETLRAWVGRLKDRASSRRTRLDIPVAHPTSSARTTGSGPTSFATRARVRG